MMINILMVWTYFEELCESCKEEVLEEDDGAFSGSGEIAALMSQEWWPSNSSHVKGQGSRITPYALLSFFAVSSIVMMIYMMCDSLSKKWRLRNLNREVILEEGNIELLSSDQAASFKRAS